MEPNQNPIQAQTVPVTSSVVMTTKAPVGVKIVSVLYFISAGLGIIGALFLFFVGQMLPLPGMVGMIAGIVALVAAVLSFFIGRGLWKLKRWAWILALIFSGLGVLGAVANIFDGSLSNGIISLVIHGGIVWYLGFKKEVKVLFSKKA